MSPSTSSLRDTPTHPPATKPTATATNQPQAVLPEAADPSSPACVRKLRRLADANWMAWARDDECAAPAGHLMTYPVSVAVTGAVGPMPGAEEFPDLGGKIVGNRGGTLPTLLTC